MNNLTVYENAEFGALRNIMINEVPWFAGKDVAVALGYKNPQKAIRDHVDEDDKIIGERNVTPYVLDSRGRKQYPTLINESGLYALIFGSNLESAKRFKRWVTSEVLPSIRKAGSYTYKQTTAQSMQVPKISDKRRELQSKVEQIAERQNLKPKQVIRKIMLELGECHNLEVAKRQYRKQYGFNPPYAMDLIEAFIVLQAKAEEIADFMLKEPTAWEKMNAETEKVFANW